MKTDLFLESLLSLLKQKPWLALLLPYWLLRGRSYAKHVIATRCSLDVTTLPYNLPFLTFLREQKLTGRRLILVTAAHRKFAEQVADHLGLFDRVLASEAHINLKGRNKLSALIELFGEHGFAYAGDAFADLTVWTGAAEAILVNAPRRLEVAVHKQHNNITASFPRTQSLWKPFCRALRPHQWTKNVLLFVPLLLSHQLMNLALVRDAIISFVAFTLCAAGVYVLNDLLDLEADRSHPRKRHRPFASGDLPVAIGFIAAPLLMLASFGVALFLPIGFLATLAIYGVLTLLYSMCFKAIVFIDVVTLSGLYTLRIIAGGQATDTSISFYTLLFSVFLFLSLALTKRFSELHRKSKEDVTTHLAANGRAYTTADAVGLPAHGVAAGYIAVLVMALYINSPDVTILYSRPQFLWFVCPLLLYWIGRTWMLSFRGEMNEDPVVFALHDRASHAIGIFTLIAVYFAT